MPKRASTSSIGRATPHEQPKARRSNNASPPASAVHLSDSELPKAYCYVELGFRCVTLLGAMSIVCAHCAACRFSAETKGICCNVGKTQPPVHPSPRAYLLSLMSFEDVDSKHFLDNIRFYNNAFQR